MTDPLQACKGVLMSAMGLNPGESVLVVTDTEKEAIGRTLARAAAELGADAVMMVMAPRQVNGEEPPEPVAAAMAASQVVLCPTSKSLTHTQARVNAACAGARIATMPGITEEMLCTGAMTADYRLVAEVTLKVKQLLDRANHARIEYKGRSLSLSLEGRTAVASTGRFLKPGESGNLPSGEAYIAPVEGTAEGLIYADGSVAGLGKLAVPLQVRVSQGVAVEFADAPSGDAGLGQGFAAQLEKLLSTFEARNVAELGIGTNHKARLTGIVLEDEKIFGTVHIAFGDNSTFGGRVRAGVHIDLVMLRPDLYLDDMLVLHDGRFVAL
ncbi:MAG: aminopeptidase [Bacillota bacterium]